MARPVTPAEQRDAAFHANLPACDDPSVLSDISSGFTTTQRRFWDSSLTILAFERVGQVAWRPWGLDHIPRRFCTGAVVVSDGVTRQISYSIREKLGWIGFSWGTEWCIDGLDRHYSYAPQCKQAKP